MRGEVHVDRMGRTWFDDALAIPVRRHRSREESLYLWVLLTNKKVSIAKAPEYCSFGSTSSQACRLIRGLLDFTNKPNWLKLMGLEHVWADSRLGSGKESADAELPAREELLFNGSGNT
ncbi:conserved hypothetical protein [Halomonas sp. 113]|nr:conserved hypothetical protein [Halomonas sp. 113]